MNNIKDKLALMAPSLVFGEGEPLTVTVPAGQFRDVAKSLRDDPQMRFDLLLCMTGMDWGETLGVVYHLRSTELGHEPPTARTRNCRACTTCGNRPT